MNETNQVIAELENSLHSGEDEVRNGSIIGIIVSQAYREFDFDFKELEKVTQRHYSHRIAILSQSLIIQDKKIRKKYQKLVKKYSKDGYSSVRRAAAFSEPGFWGLEKKKNQVKNIKNLIKNMHKLDESYFEGILLGIGINSQDFEEEVIEDVIAFYTEAIKYSGKEKISIALSYGVSLFGVITGHKNEVLPILSKIIKETRAKRAKNAVAESLAFLNGSTTIEEAINIIKYLIDYPAYQETWPLNLSILLASINNNETKNKKTLLSFLHEQTFKEPEQKFLLEQLETNSDPLVLLEVLLSSEFSQLKLASMFTTYFAEHHKDRLKKKDKDFQKYADLVVKMIKDSSGTIRSFALYRLLSYSLTLKTDQYIEYFKSGLRDQLKRNRLVSSIALTYLTILMKPENLEILKNELMETRDPQVKKGLFIGMGMGTNPAIKESANADELILGLLELSGEATNIGYILSINNYE